MPVKLTYKNGEVKIRYLWRFRPPTQADIEAVQAAKEELARLQPRWEAQDLIPTEDIPEGEKTREPRNMGLIRWRDLFLPRQLLTNVVILEEICTAQARARAELPEAEAEAVSVYLAFILSKVVNYNSVNTFWDYTRRKGAQTFSRHDFAFRPAFCEFEGARETVLWGAAQVINAYDSLARLMHGEPVSLEGADDEEMDELDEEADDAGEAVEAPAPSEQTGESHLRPEVIVPTITCDDAAAVFRRSRQLLHPAGRMGVMFDHRLTRAWRALGMALIRAGFDIRSSVPIHTEAESSLNIRGLDAARSTVLLLCQPHEESEQPVGNWGTVQQRVARVARGAAVRFQKQGLSGTDLYLSALGPALGEVARQWPVTDLAGRPIDLGDALDEAYKAVARWRLEQIFAD